MAVSESTDLQVILPPFLPKEEAKLMMAVKLYEVGRLTLGQAAVAAGYSKRAFLDELGSH